MPKRWCSFRESTEIHAGLICKPIYTWIMLEDANMMFIIVLCILSGRGTPCIYGYFAEDISATHQKIQVLRWYVLATRIATYAEKMVLLSWVQGKYIGVDTQTNLHEDNACHSYIAFSTRNASFPITMLHEFIRGYVGTRIATYAEKMVFLPWVHGNTSGLICTPIYTWIMLEGANMIFIIVLCILSGRETPCIYGYFAEDISLSKTHQKMKIVICVC